MRTLMNPLLLATVAALLGGCAAPRVMLSNTFVGGRSVKYVMQKTGNETTTNSAGQTTAGAGMYDYSVLVCDFDDNGDEKNCGDTLILRNVTLSP